MKGFTCVPSSQEEITKPPYILKCSTLLFGGRSKDLNKTELCDLEKVT